LNGGDYQSRATIHLYGWPDSLTNKFPQGTKRHHLAGLDLQRSFGMQVEQIGTRWYCRWDREDWRRFALEHVLPHEIGHHVCGPSEQLADDYALRYLQILKDGSGALASRASKLGSHGKPSGFDLRQPGAILMK
jgi:hypothetical protein